MIFVRNRQRGIVHPALKQQGEKHAPQQILETLQDRSNQSVRLRCTSGSEYTVTNLFQWLFMPEERVLTLVLDGHRTVRIDPMLVESVLTESDAESNEVVSEAKTDKER